MSGEAIHRIISAFGGSLIVMALKKTSECSRLMILTARAISSEERGSSGCGFATCPVTWPAICCSRSRTMVTMDVSVLEFYQAVRAPADDQDESRAEAVWQMTCYIEGRLHLPSVS